MLKFPTALAKLLVYIYYLELEGKANVLIFFVISFTYKKGNTVTLSVNKGHVDITLSVG